MAFGGALGQWCGGLAAGAFGVVAVRWNQRESAKLGEGPGPHSEPGSGIERRG